MIYCPGCGTANRDGSRFCNECGTKMPTMTSSLCPTCGTPNPPHSLFCEKCGTRFIASLAEEPEEPESTTPAIVVPKGLSLPTKSVSTPEPSASTAPTKSEEEELPDWMQVVQAGGTTSELDRTKAVAPDQPVSSTEEVPAWLAGLDTGGEALVEEKKPDTDELLPEWTQRLRTLPETDQPAVAEEDEVPDWLKVLGTTGRLPSGDLPPISGAATPALPEEKPAWLSEVPALASGDFGPETPAAETEELPDWLKEVPQPAEPLSAAEPPPSPPVVEAKPATDEMPDWLRDLRPAASTTDDSLPDWLDELGAEEEPASESLALSSGDSALDWLSQLSATAPEAPLDQSTVAAAETQPTESVTPDWMSSLRAAAPEVDSQPAEEMPAWLSAAETPAASEVPDWMSSFRTAEPAAGSVPEEAGVPDMAALRAAAVDADQSKPEAEPFAEPGPASKPVTDWLSSLRRATPEMEEEQAQAEEEAAEIPAWLRESGAAPQAVGEPQAYEQEIPEWARESGTSEPSAAVHAEEEGVPEWLKGLGEAAVGPTQAEPEAEPVPASKPVTDWLSSLRRATPEMEEEQAQAEEEAAEIPAWLRNTGAAPESAGEPQAYEQEIPEWARESGTSEPPAAVQAEEEGVPAWLKGLGEAAVITAQAEPEAEPVPETKPVTDWLSSLRQAAPEMEAEQAAEEEAAEIPEWLRESGAAPEAVGGPQVYEQEMPEWLRESGAGAGEPPVATQAEEEAAEIPEWLRDTGVVPQALGEPQIYEQEVPAWLRESGAGAGEPPAAAQTEEEGVPEWLKGLGMATAGEAAVDAAQAEPVPESKPATDWLSSLRQAAPEMEAEQAAEEVSTEIPEWMRETGAAPQAIGGPQAHEQEVPDWLREAEPTPSITRGDFGPVETPTEATEEGEVPEWLRDLTPAPAVAGAATMTEAEPEEVVEEPEPPEEIEELEPETAGEVSEVAAVASAAAAAALGAVKGAKAEAVPAEMPSWLKELRQEQEAAQSTIQVPPAEAAELTQAEIPVWLEALRPKGPPPSPLAAETPSEAEGPLAGIANALPPTPLMGQVQGAPMKLQFETSAEDLARAGVLKELLGRPTVAPASLEQFVVKSSAVRRRSLRWTMAALFIFVLMLPLALNLNSLLTEMAGEKVEILPNVKTMYVPAAVTSAAIQIKALPESAKVLVVFDYDAAQAGEMKYIAQALLKGLAARSARVEIASLNPQGISLAQQALTDAGLEQSANLGYAPGQVNGVQDVLARMGDVKLVIDLAASADTVRWWAEQMKTSNLSIPFVVGISAGAETLTAPYLQSKQVIGMVSGLPGALAFLKGTTLINTYPPDIQRDYQVALDGVSLANYTLAVLIIIGLIAALFGGKRKGARS